MSRSPQNLIMVQAHLKPPKPLYSPSVSRVADKARVERERRQQQTLNQMVPTPNSNPTMYQPPPPRPQVTPQTEAVSLQESLGSAPVNSNEPSTSGGTQNGDLAKAESITNLTQKKMDDVLKHAMRIKHHEDNLRFLKAEIDKLDESISDTQAYIGKYHSSSVALVEKTNLQTEKQTIDQILEQESSAAGVLCQLKGRHGALASQLPFTRDVLGIVATLGKVEDENLSKLLSEFLGLETMMAIVCKTYEGVKALEVYDEGGIKKNLGLCGLGPSLGRRVDGRFQVISLQSLRPYIGEFIANDPQRKLALLKPKLPNGELPRGFLGFAVNMINLENINLSYLTPGGHGLRETLFYSLFSRLQVYKTRQNMHLALPCISDGAISLDGGIIRTTGIFSLGDRNEIAVRFPVSNERLNIPVNYGENVQQLKVMKWEKERLYEDIEREGALLNQVKLSYTVKKDEYTRFLAESEEYVKQHQLRMQR